MNLKDLLLERKSAIVKKWFDLIIGNYPVDTSNFFKKQKDRFLNPVGHTISQNIDGIFDELLKGLDSEKVSSYLNDIIKIKAVQDFSPSQALSFIFHLKKAVRGELKSEIEKNRIFDELRSFESQIDSLALLSFDMYMQCREKIYELKANEVKRMTYRLLQRANLICEIQEQESNLKSKTVLTQNIKG